MRAARGILAAVLVLALVACASLAAQTPEQKAYAALGEYTLAVNAAASFCSEPSASFDLCMQLVTVDRQIRPIVELLELQLGAPPSVSRDEAILDLVRALIILTAQLQSGVAGGVAS